MSCFEILLLAFAIICCFGIQIEHSGQDYLSVERTTAIKGVFTILILFSHLMGYCSVDPTKDLGARFLTLLGQMVVVMFFFYSGFGIMRQYEKRGSAYVRGFPKKRLLKVLVHFDLAVLCFIIVQLMLKHRFSAFEYGFCWIGWTSVGNSNWFIFDILALYLLIYLALSAKERFQWSRPAFIASVWALTLFLWLFLYTAKSGMDWWVNTLVAFPLGITFSGYQLELDTFLKENRNRHLALVVSAVICWLLWRFFVGIDRVGISAILFAICVLSLSTVVSVGNPVLAWLGRLCFPIYILQRIPMIFFSSFGLNSTPLAFSVICIVVTMGIAAGFHWLTKRMDRLLFTVRDQ